MLDLMRRHAYSWATRAILVFITLVFIFWGIGSGLFQQVHPVATVDGQRIVNEQVTHEADRLRQMLQQMYGANAAAVLKNMNLRTDRTDLLMEDTTHKSMTHNPLLQKQIVLDILEICPPRQQWVGHPMGRPGGTAAVLVNAPGE